MAFPELFKQQVPLYKKELENLLQSLNELSPTSIRLNKSKIKSLKADQVLWVDEAYYLEKRPSFFADPLWHAGAYYVQEASSMFIAYVLKQLMFDENKQLRFLDACAAPGGKSLILSDFLVDKGVLISNEPIPKRNKILQENLAKWGNSNFLVTQNFTTDFCSEGYFDLLLVDAPCSGEGMFRKDLNAREEWSETNVITCVERQKQILENVTPTLQKEGYLIYSTCTFNEKENEEQIENLLKSGFELINFEIDPSWGIEKSEMGYRFYPHKLKGEGFFCAVLQKKSGVENSSIKREKRKKEINWSGKLSKTVANTFKNITLNKQQLMALAMEENEIKALEKSGFYFTKKGIELGELKGETFIPGTELSRQNMELSYPVYNLSYDEALSYLSMGGLNLNTSQKGFFLVEFEGMPLGFVKHLGNRTNNLYRKDWRLRRMPMEEEKFTLFSNY